MGQSDKAKVNFITDETGNILSFQSLRLPATHILNDPSGLPKDVIAVNETEFLIPAARARMVPINQWLQEHKSEIEVNKMTLAEWRELFNTRRESEV